MRLQLTTTLVVLIAVGTTASATSTRVWEFVQSSTLPPTPLAIRVHQLTPGEIRVFDQLGRASDVLSVRSRSTGSTAVEAFRIAKAGTQTPTDLCHFTGEGTLALFEPVEEDRPLYARSFDVDRRTFIGAPVRVEHVLRFVAGPREVAVFTEDGPHKGDRSTPPDELRVSVITCDGDKCKLTTRWENRSYTYGIALDNNAVGDVVALVGKCEGGAVRFDCTSYRLIVLRPNGSVLEREIPEATRASTVAISQSGEWAAVTLGGQIATYRLRNAFIDDGPGMTLGDCAPAGMWRMSVSDTPAIVGVAISKGRVAIVCTRPAASCEVVTSQPSDDVLATDVRFFQPDRFYVATTASDVSKSRLAIFHY